MRKAIMTALLVLPSLWLGSAQASEEVGLAMKAGAWKFDISVLMPMSPEPIEQSLEPCLTGEPMTPSSLMPWAKDQNCKLKGAKIKENKLTWKIICSMNGQIARGKAHFEMQDDQATGRAKVNFDAAGSRMSIVTEWTAKRLGECAASIPSPAESTPETSPEK